jgi:hypothetical protein
MGGEPALNISLVWSGCTCPKFDHDVAGKYLLLGLSGSSKPPAPRQLPVHLHHQEAFLLTHKYFPRKLYVRDISKLNLDCPPVPRRSPSHCRSHPGYLTQPLAGSSVYCTSSTSRPKPGSPSWCRSGVARRMVNSNTPTMKSRSKSREPHLHIANQAGPQKMQMNERDCCLVMSMALDT